MLRASWRFAAVLLLLSPALLRAQDEPSDAPADAPAESAGDAGPKDSGRSLMGAGLSRGLSDKAPTATPKPAASSDDGGCPATTPTAPVDATPGWLGDLAFDSTRGRWLVVSHGGTINGRLMGDDGQPAGPVFTVNAAGQADGWSPMTEYSPDADKYLVVWVDYTGGVALWGRFVSGAGALEEAFPIPFDGAPGQPTLNLGGERTSALRYDAGARVFVLATDARADKDHVVVTTIDLNGKRGKLVEVGSMANGGNWAPSVAVGRGEYCVAWDQRNAPKWAVARVDAATLQAGAETNFSFTTTNVDIAFNGRTGKYLAIYDAGYGVGVRGRILNSCSVNDAGADFLLLPKEGYSSVAGNARSGVWAAIGQDGEDYGNGYGVAGPTGAVLARDALFTTGSKNGNYLPVIKANTLTGTFAAISARDYAMTRFVARIGCGGGVATPPSDGLSWVAPQNGGRGSGIVGLSGTAASSIKKVEILVNLKKVGDATLAGGVWSYALDTSAYSGGINLSALATDDKGVPARWTIRFNVVADKAP